MTSQASVHHASPSARLAANGAPAAVAPPALELFDPRIDGAPGLAEPRRPYSAEEVRSYLVDLLVEKTGYPAEAFEDQLDLEADLGVDSVKQLEVMAAVREHYQLPLD